MRKVEIIRLLLITYFLVMAVVVHILNKGLNWNQIMLSGYVQGPGGSAFMISILAFGLFQLLVAYDYYRSQVLSSLFFFMAGLGAITLAIFPVNLANVWSPVSATHMVGAAMQFFFFPMALIFFKHEKSKLHLYTQLTGFVTMIMFVVLSVLVFTDNWQGIAQKSTILVVLVWYYISTFFPGGDLRK